MQTITHPAHYGDVIKTLEITQPVEGGGIYQVFVDNYYHGVMHQMDGQWTVHFNNRFDITGPDVLILGEMIEEGFGNIQ